MNYYQTALACGGLLFTLFNKPAKFRRLADVPYQGASRTVLRHVASPPRTGKRRIPRDRSLWLHVSA
jgi:hypothetical protein